MNGRQHQHVLVYASFLVLAGIFGYFIGPNHARTAIIGGIGGGVFIASLYTRVRNKVPWATSALRTAIGVFTLTFVWRAVGAWSLVFQGQDDRRNIAMLLSVMFVVSLAEVIHDLRRK